MSGRGERAGLVTYGADGCTANSFAFVWVDRERRYFISTCSSLVDGAPYERKRIRQLLPVETQADPEKVTIEVSQPIAAEIYYGACAKIDQGNRHRQDTLMIEKKIETNDWDLRVNLSIFAMIVVDTWLLYSQCTKTKSKQRSFYMHLAEELIDNTYDAGSTPMRNTRQASQQVQELQNMSPAMARIQEGQAVSGLAAHLTPTKKRRRGTNHMQQNRCAICRKKTIYVCSQCRDSSNCEVGICHSKTGRPCFNEHVTQMHLDIVMSL